jgi:hypothetical protein
VPGWHLLNVERVRCDEPAAVIVHHIAIGGGEALSYVVADRSSGQKAFKTSELS